MFNGNRSIRTKDLLVDFFALFSFSKINGVGVGHKKVQPVT